MPATLPALLMFGTPVLVHSDRAGVEAAVAAIYRPYGQAGDPDATWDRPVWSAEVAALIGRWKKVMPEDEPDELGDGDWLCLCQDWDAEAFRARLLSSEVVRPDAARVRVQLDLGSGVTRETRLNMLRQAGQWKIDDLFAADFPRGLKQALRETIAKDSRR